MGLILRMDGGGLQLPPTLDTINADGSVENILQHPFIKETQLEDQSEIIFPIKHDPFNVTKVMVVWTDPPGTQSSPSLDSNTGGGFNNKKLINDIDIKIIGPNGSEYFPWVLGTGDLEGSPKTLGNNITDNIEQVCIWETEPAGVYTVKITHKKTKPGNAIRHLLDEQGNTAPQPLSIYIQKNQLNNEPPLRIPFQIVGWDRVGPTQFMLSFSSVVGGIYQIERSTNLTDWTVDPGEILPNSILTTATVNTNAGTANEYFRVRQIR